MAKQAELNLNLTGTVKLLDDVEGSVVVTLTYDQFTITAKGDTMFTLPDDKKVTVKVAYVDAQGHPAKVDGPVTWSSSDNAIATVTVDAADSSKATVAPSSAAGSVLGQAQITAEADADLGAGTRTLITTFDVEVVAGAAVKGTIQPVGDPVPI